MLSIIHFISSEPEIANKAVNQFILSFSSTPFIILFSLLELCFDSMILSATYKFI